MSQTTLAANVAATDTSITVASVTDLAGIKVPPYWVAINAEDLKVIADSGGGVLVVERDQASLLQIVTVDGFQRDETDQWGYADDSVSRWQGGFTSANVEFNVLDGYGSMNALTTNGELPALITSLPIGDIQVRFKFRLMQDTDVIIDTYVRSATDPGNNGYRARLTIDGAGAMNLRLSKNVANVNTALVASVVPSGTVVVDDEVQVALQAVGNGTTSLGTKAWRTADGEPAAWQTTATDTEATLQGPNFSALRYRSSTVTPNEARFDDYTVSRVPEGVAHTSGDTVVLVEEWPFASDVVVGRGAPVSNPPTGAQYLDVSVTPAVLYLRVGAVWRSVTLT